METLVWKTHSCTWVVLAFVGGKGEGEQREDLHCRGLLILMGKLMSLPQVPLSPLTLFMEENLVATPGPGF